MPTASEIAQEFQDEEDVTTTTDDSQEDTNTDVEDTSTDDNSSDDNDNKDEAVVDDKKVVKDDDTGYYADDEEPEDTKAEELPPAPASFTPEEKYIVDNLPLISVRVVMSDDSIKTVQVRSAAELPADAKGYASFREGELFKQNSTAQELRARELQTYYRQHQTQVQTQEFERKENASIRSDIADLQREGEIPKFKATPGTKAFESDPGAKVVDEVIAYMNERNAKYLERSNAGGSYRHIGFAEAYELMNGKSANKIDAKDSSARKDAARKLVSKQGGSSSKAPKAPVSGRTMREVAAEFEDFEG